MFLARRELRFAWGRFALMGSVIALVGVLTVMLSGLATGLVDDGISGLRALPVSHLAFQPHTDSTFSRSTIDVATVEQLNETSGVRAEPLGLSLFNARSSAGATVDLALFGFQPGGFVAADLFGGSLPDAASNGVVITEGLADSGVRVGDQLSFDRSDTVLTVAGIAPKSTYGHVDVAYTALPVWQAATYSSLDATAAAQLVSSAAIVADGGVDLDAVEVAADLDIVTKTAAFDGSPGYTAETSTMTLIRGFLYVIAAMILGAFFTVWTIQRRAEIGLQKALGASTRAVLIDALGQVLVVLVGATAVGVAIGLALGALISGGTVPFSLQAGPVLAASVALIASGVVGMLVGIRRITSVDPIIALEGAR
jgi:putative ABC transport system permease protein